MKRRITTIVAGVLIAVGAGALTTAAIAPEAVEATVGETKIAVEQSIEAARQHIAEAVTGKEQPVVTLVLDGTASSQAELDAAPAGQFVYVTNYGTSVIPTWAAHNLHGGDHALGLVEGDLVALEGDVVGRFRVVEVRDIAKAGDVSELDGMRGQLALQTCPYDDPQSMRVVGLERVGE